MSDNSTDNKTPPIENFLIEEAKYLLRNFIGSGEEIRFRASEEWMIRIIVRDMCINKLRALTPLIEKHGLLWYITSENYASSEFVQMTLFKPKKDIVSSIPPQEA